MGSPRLRSNVEAGSAVSKRSLLNAALVVAALGYFVDIYDLLLFSIVRVDSLRSIGFAGRELEVGATLS
ncbi:MAG: hypothetical protein EBX52_00935, partial [Proteobacteria bacterium]|nr:hypothetical protein [Pseudomonadota bacterium]